MRSLCFASFEASWRERAALARKVKSHETSHETSALPEQIPCNVSLFLLNDGKEEEGKKTLKLCGQSCKSSKCRDWLLHWCSLKSSRQKKLRWTYPVSVWGNLWGLKQSTVQQQPAQSHLASLSQWKVAKQLARRALRTCRKGTM